MMREAGGDTGQQAYNDSSLLTLAVRNASQHIRTADAAHVAIPADALRELSEEADIYMFSKGYGNVG